MKDEQKSGKKKVWIKLYKSKVGNGWCKRKDLHIMMFSSTYYNIVFIRGLQLCIQFYIYFKFYQKSINLPIFIYYL